MKLKKLILSMSLLACCIASTSSLAAKAAPGLRIFNQSYFGSSYTTNNPSGCSGVTFPTPIAANSNGTVTISTKFAASGGVCSTQYVDSKKDLCLVSVVSNPTDNTVTIHASQLAGGGGAGDNCKAISGKTAVTLP